jgi:hypothetical protein
MYTEQGNKAFIFKKTLKYLHFLTNSIRVLFVEVTENAIFLALLVHGSYYGNLVSFLCFSAASVKSHWSNIIPKSFMPLYLCY